MAAQHQWGQTPLVRGCSGYHGDMAEILEAGNNALLVELGEALRGHDLAAAAVAVGALPGVESCVVGHASLYVVFDVSAGSVQADQIRAAIDESSNLQDSSGESAGHLLRVSVHPDAAPDLELLEESTGQSRASLIEAMRELDLTVRYTGFRPGFAYLEGLPPSWQLPRHARPRSRVAAGSFGIAGSMCAFYPADSPGGWNIIGRTDAALWDPSRNPPNLFSAGDRVRIEPVESMLSPAPQREVEPLHAGDPVATFARSGQGTCIAGPRDPGRQRFGLPPSGPFDDNAAAAANLAVGNDPDAAVIECAMVGPSLRFSRPAKLSWFGARMTASIDGKLVSDPRMMEVSEGSLLEIGRITGGLRGVLALRGGVADPAPRYSIGPARVRPGDPLRCMNAAGAPRTLDLAREDRLRIRVRRGPHEVPDRLFAVLLRQRWRVSHHLDRVGIRLTCESSAPEIPADLPSCGMQFGTVQWHPGGDLVAMGPDHPVTGGYLQVMTLLVEERWKLAQLMPGEEVMWIEK